MSTNELQQSILEAVDLLSQRAAQSTNAAITIKGEVIEQIDEGSRQYKVSYGGTTFDDCYSIANANYEPSSVVYLLVPDGDLSNSKIILGSVNPVSVNYATEKESDSYVTISENLFGQVVYGVSKDEESIIIPLKTWVDQNISTWNSSGSKEGKIIIKQKDNFRKKFSDYINNIYHSYKTFRFSAYIKTNIDVNHQAQGDYGIYLSLPFINTSTKDKTKITRDFMMNVANITGNPYSLQEYQKVELYFTIANDWEYNKSLSPSLTAYTSNFGYSQETIGQIEKTADIWIKDVSLEMVEVLSKQEVTGYKLFLTASNGNYYLSSNDHEVKTLTPLLKLDGKTVNITDWECYWFKKDIVDTLDRDYLSLAGIDWRCLNKKTKVNPNDENKDTFQYDTSEKEYTVSADAVKTTSIYRCILVKKDAKDPKNNHRVDAEIYLKNLESGTSVWLESITGESVFAEGIGDVTLRAIIRTNTPIPTQETGPHFYYNVKWRRFDKDGNFLSDVIENNEVPFYIIDKALYLYKTEIENEITYYSYAIEISYPTAIVDQKNIVYAYFYQMNEEGNQINIGNDNIVITTSKNLQYNAMITGANVLYKYDADGDSPLIAAYDGKDIITYIEPLYFKVFKPDGHELSEKEYSKVKCTWRIPVNSMITIKKPSVSEKNKQIINNLEYYVITVGYGTNDQLCVIEYTIKDSYDASKSDNNFITLEVEYDNKLITDVVNIPFIKDGESGTNGTKYSVRIVYCDKNNNKFAYGERDDNGIARKCHLVWVNDNKLHSDRNPGWYIHNQEKNILDNNDPDGRRSSNALTNDTCPCFDIRVYKSGVLVNNPKIESISWNIFDFNEDVKNKVIINKNKSAIESPFNIIKKNNNIGQLQIRDKMTIEGDPSAAIDYGSWRLNVDPCTIVQCAVVIEDEDNVVGSKGKIYAYYPIDMTYMPDFYTYSEGSEENKVNYIPNLEGGFNQVLYDSDGANPDYNNTNYVLNYTEGEGKEEKSFTANFQCTSNSKAEADFFPSSHYLENKDKYGYIWSNSGNGNLKNAISNDYLPGYAYIIPSDRYNNGFTNNYIKVTLKFTKDTETAINTTIDKKNTYLGILNGYRSIADNNKKQLNDLYGKGKKFDYDNWKSIINDPIITINNNNKQLYVKTFLKYRYNAINIILNLLNLLNEIDTYIKANEDYFKNLIDYNFISYPKILNDYKAYLYINLGSNPQPSSNDENCKDINGLRNKKINEDMCIDKKPNSNNRLSEAEKKKLLLDIVGKTYITYIEHWESLRKSYNKYIDKLTETEGALLYKYRYENWQLYKFKHKFLDFDGFEKLQPLIIKDESQENIVNSSFNDNFTFYTGWLTKNKEYFSKEVLNHTLYSYNDYIDILKQFNDLIKDNIYLYKDYINNHYKEVTDYIDKTKSQVEKQIEENNILLLPKTSTQLVHIKPIVMTTNRYGFGHLNDWDGSKIYIDKDNDQYILAPQFGAGSKNEDNSFTGVLMGTIQLNTTAYKNRNDNQKIGLFGLHNGKESFFINSRDGSAIFGESGEGRIIIDPSPDKDKGKALLYNSTYFADYEYGAEGQGKPTDYSHIEEAVINKGIKDKEYTRQGMLINLTDSYIHLADAKAGKIYSGDHKSIKNPNTGFYLSSDGLSIVGQYEEETGEDADGDGRPDDKQIITSKIIMKTNGYPTIYSNNHSSLGKGGPGFYLSEDGLSIGTDFIVYAKATKKHVEGEAHLRQIGSTLAGWTVAEHNVKNEKTGKDEPKFGLISEDNKGIFMDSETSTVVLGSTEGRIYSGSHYSLDTSSKGFYLSHDGLSIGGEEGKGKFTVDTSGVAKIYSGDHKTFTANEDGFYLGKEGLAIGSNFIISANGAATISDENSRIGGWSVEVKRGVDNKPILDSKGKQIPIGFTNSSGGILIDSSTSSIALGYSSGKIYSGNHLTLNNTSKGFYLSEDGLSISNILRVVKEDDNGSKKVNSGKLLVGILNNNTDKKYWTIGGVPDEFKDVNWQPYQDDFNGRFTKNYNKGKIFVRNHNFFEVLKNVTEGDNIIPSKTDYWIHDGEGGIFMMPHDKGTIFYNFVNEHKYLITEPVTPGTKVISPENIKPGEIINCRIVDDIEPNCKYLPPESQDHKWNETWKEPKTSNNSYISYNTTEKLFKVDENRDPLGVSYKTIVFDVDKVNDNGKIKTKIKAKNNEVYIGTNGFRLGKSFAIDESGVAYFKGHIEADHGLIGGWTISEKGLFLETWNGIKTVNFDHYGRDKNGNSINKKISFIKGLELLKGNTSDNDSTSKNDGEWGVGYHYNQDISFSYYIQFDDGHREERTFSKHKGQRVSSDDIDRWFGKKVYWHAYCDGSFNVHTPSSNFGGIFIEEEGTHFHTQQPRSTNPKFGVFREQAQWEIEDIATKVLKDHGLIPDD